MNTLLERLHQQVTEGPPRTADITADPKTVTEIFCKVQQGAVLSRSRTITTNFVNTIANDLTS